MKIIRYLLILFYFANAQSQHFEAVYQESYILEVPEANDKIVRQLHDAHTGTLSVAGKQSLYVPNGTVEEVKQFQFTQSEKNTNTESGSILKRSDFDESRDVSARFANTYAEFYTNFQEKQRTSRYQNQKSYIVDEPLPEIRWTVKSNKKLVGTYLCQLATATIEENEVNAWFTKKVPGPFGPGVYWGLPGLILQVEVDRMLITLKEITFDTVSREYVKAPTEGIQVSREQYDIIAFRIQQTKDATEARAFFED